MHSDNCMGTVRRGVLKLVDVCQDLADRLSAEGQPSLAANDRRLLEITVNVKCMKVTVVFSLFAEADKMNQYAGMFTTIHPLLI